jgi:glycogen phosphorylase
VQRLAAERRAHLDAPGWFPGTHGGESLGGVAYFSLEFGLGDALPLYAGGLGVLAGDCLKAASDLAVPLVGIGLLYQEGYFRQIIDAAGEQQEAYPYNDPTSLPIRPVPSGGRARLHIPLELPGRTLQLRVWQAAVGRSTLYLLDSNDPLNSPADRGITGKLYGGGTEMRLAQEIVLGIGGWRAVQALAPQVEVCHLNEGHAAFVVIERTRQHMVGSGLSFWEAFWATRAGNVFTTHTPVGAGFDRYPPDLVRKYLPYFERFFAETGTSLAELMALGRAAAHDDGEPFNMAYLAMRGSLASYGVSCSHEIVARRIFEVLFPRWPSREVPIGHITNGIHVPSWDSAAADWLWTTACGKERWRQLPGEDMSDRIGALPDEALWTLRGDQRQELVASIRVRLARQLGERGAVGAKAAADAVLDPNVLTLGLARRFTGYKRPNLLLKDRARLARLLNDPEKPTQLIVAGKAHPADREAKEMVREWVALAQLPAFRHRVAFLQDYDISLAQELVQGVDVWINTPRQGWEACGTSGMKVLVNGGLNLSQLDGWWAEAYHPAVGWAIGVGDTGTGADADAGDAEALYRVLEQEVAPAFYRRDALGLPRDWLGLIRRSMADLASVYSASRAIRDYVVDAYLPAAAEVRRRQRDRSQAAVTMQTWAERVRRHWAGLHLGPSTVGRNDGARLFSVPVYLGQMAAGDVRIELYADPAEGSAPEILPLAAGEAIPGVLNGRLYRARVKTARPAEDYTARILPDHPGARIPGELPLILWQR